MDLDPEAYSHAHGFAFFPVSPPPPAAIANMDAGSSGRPPRSASLSARPAANHSAVVRLYTCVGTWLHAEDADGEPAERLYYLPSYDRKLGAVQLLGYTSVGPTGLVGIAQLTVPLPDTDAICVDEALLLLVGVMRGGAKEAEDRVE